MPRPALVTVVAVLVAPIASAQSFNLDFGPEGTAPPSTYAAAGGPGVWHSLPAAHTTTTHDLVDVHGRTTAVSLLQIGGTETLLTSDPDTSGDDAALMDDYLVTFDGGLETCIFLDGMAEGEYEVLIYARMPNASAVLSDTFVDQEAGIPHYEVGGEWPGGHQELVTYSRHVATVGSDGNLDFHSGIADGGVPAQGAALNGVQIRPLALFADGFETGDTTAWN